MGVTLGAIARLEARGEKPARLLDPEHQRWQLFRRKLGWWDLIGLLHADAAQQYPIPFDLSRWCDGALDEPTAQRVVRTAAEAGGQDAPDSMDWLRACAIQLGLPGGTLPDAPKIQPAHRVLMLPGTGGRVAAYQCLRESGLDYGNQFDWITASAAELVCVGLGAVETGARVEPGRVHSPQWLAEQPASGLRFDRVIGLRSVSATLPHGLDDQVRWV